MALSSRVDFSRYLPPRYQIGAILSATDLSVTYKVYDSGLRRTRAVVKVQELGKSGDVGHAQSSFEQYCKRLVSVAHPSVSTPYTYGVLTSDEGYTYGYSTRPFVDGLPLSAIQRPLQDEALLRVTTQLCRGLEALSEYGLRHHDLKCDNVVVRRAAAGTLDHFSQCVLIDLSYRAQHDCQKLNEVTLQYLAPELLEGAPSDERADLYSLGVLLYRLASGRLPFEGAPLGAVLRQQRARDYQPLSISNHDAEIRALVHALIEPNPENRPQSAQAVLAHLGTSRMMSPAGVVNDPLTPVGFVGRQSELQRCMEMLERPEAPGAIEVNGDSGAGVTTFLRELQDRLETRSVAVLSAHPSVIEGESIREQLSRPISRLARESRGESSDPDTRPRTATELLDDLLVAAESHRLVLFVDQWRRCSVGEAVFLSRVVRQFSDGTPVGRVHLVLGWSGVDSADTVDVLDPFLAERVTLQGLDRDELASLVRYSCGSDWPRADVGLLHAETGGIPGVAVRLVRDAWKRVQDGDALTDALVSSASAVRMMACGGPLLDHILNHPSAHAVTALAAWNEWVSDEEWRTICDALGTDVRSASRFVERDQDNNVRALHHSAWQQLWASLAQSSRARIVDAVVSARRSAWRAEAPAPLIAILMFVGRTHLPRRCRWHARRALLVLLRAGQLADVEWCAQALQKSASASEHAWLSLFVVAAQTESGRRGDGDLVSPESMAAPRTTLDFYRQWIEARAWRRAGYSREAHVALRTAQAAHASVGAALYRCAFLEDCGLVAAEMDDNTEARRARKEILRLSAEWVALVHKLPGAAALRLRRSRAALRGCRKAAHYYRVRYRACMNRSQYRSAVSAARRERMLNRIAGDRVREAQCLNNEGIALYRAGAGTAAAGVFERCAKHREALDDERGLAVTLNNLAATLSAGGRFGRVASVLNRARVIATRNGLARLRNMAMLGLGVAYARRGQFREAQSVFRRTLRGVTIESDPRMWFKAAYNCAAVGLDRWRTRSVAAHLRAIEQNMRSHVPPADAHPLLLRSERACRAGDLKQLRLICKGTDHGAVIVPQQPFYDVLISGVYDRQTSASAGVRLRILAAKWSSRMSFSSLRRLLAFSRRYGAIRERLELVNGYYRAQAEVGADELAYGTNALSWLEFREGHDDLQIELRAHLSRLLASAGRTREAWSLLEAALFRFRRLERKLSQGEEGLHVLGRLDQALRTTMSSHDSAMHDNGGRLSEALCAAAFRTFLRFRGARAGAVEHVQSAIGSLATVLENEMTQGSVESLLDIAIDATGAERALVVVEEAGTRRIHTSRARTDRGGEGEISWATVAKTLATSSPQCFSDALSAEELASHRSVAVLRLRSLACIPIRLVPGSAAALYVDHQGLAGLFDESDMALLRVVAATIGGSLRCGALESQAQSDKREVQAAHAHMVRTERNRVFGEVAGGISHDLRNILTAIIARSQILRHREEDATVASLRAIENAAMTGAGLLERLQQCSRDHTVQRPEALNLAVVAREAIELIGYRFGRSAEEQIRYHVEAVADPLVLAVPGELREVFLNLVANACDAMVGGGLVSICIHKDEDHVVAEVSDTGQGMPAETVSRAFEPFFTTKGSAGTGLGLVVVQNTLARCGGTVDIRSEVGKGTCFRVRLPAYRGGEATRRKAT